MKKDVIIIGAGVVGLMTAYSLQKAGRSVTVIDEGNISDCTSFGNAGLLSAFDKTPLSNPDEVKVTSSVNWNTPSGVQTVTFSENLFNWIE
jgi:D-amino-acid dehydrogenase